MDHPTTCWHERAYIFERSYESHFWCWVDPQAERARAYLLGWSAAVRLEAPPGSEDDVD